jgi:T4 superinfection immunity protein
MEPVIGLLMLLGVALYFLPAIITEVRKPKHSTAICLVNALFGWTIVGWVAALVWAIVEIPEAAKA